MTLLLSIANNGNHTFHWDGESAIFKPNRYFAFTQLERLIPLLTEIFLTLKYSQHVTTKMLNFLEIKLTASSIYILIFLVDTFLKNLMSDLPVH